jgi:hypothetical protein
MPSKCRRFHFRQLQPSFRAFFSVLTAVWFTYSIPGANPTIAGYNASGVKIWYNDNMPNEYMPNEKTPNKKTPKIEIPNENISKILIYRKNVFIFLIHRLSAFFRSIYLSYVFGF